MSKSNNDSDNLWDGGWWRLAKRCPSPNFNERPPGEGVSLLVVHNISLPPNKFGGGYVQQFFCNQLDVSKDAYFSSISHLKVAAHFFVERHGAVTQFVSTDCRAWHAGQSCFSGRENCNDFSVGIELEGADHIPYTAEQYAALVELSRSIVAKYPQVNMESIVGHEHIAPGRKTDPGPSFDWRHYRKALFASENG